VSTRNQGTYENPPDFSAETWNIVQFKEMESDGVLQWLFRPKLCMHCTKAACVEVCPTYARTYDPLGFVTIDQERCIACVRCVSYCPFSVPRIGNHDTTDRIKVEIATPRTVAYNCAFCRDRVADGLTPACAKTCPSGAIQFGEREQLIERGRARVNKLKATHPHAYLYGEKELGGLHVMYVLTEEVSVYDLPKDPRLARYPAFNAAELPAWYKEAVATGKLPAVPPGLPKPAPRGVRPLGYIGAALAGVGRAFKWLTHRKTSTQ